MKFSLTTLTSALYASSSILSFLDFVQAGDCSPEPLEFHDSIAMKVEKVGSVVTQSTDAFSYNMQLMDNFDGDVLYIVEQQFGKIYSYDTSTDMTKTVFDVDSSPIPSGLTLDWQHGAAQTFKVKSMTQGSSSDEVIVVFSSTTLPDGWTAPDATLPPPGAYGMWMCGGKVNGTVWVDDIYRIGELPYCFDGRPDSFMTYDVFYKYYVVDGELTNPQAFFASENQVSPGHMGGGIVTVPDGRILWSPGDCTIYGLDGHYAPQLDFEWCGKIHLIDPSKKGIYNTVAKGVRNSQQMQIFSKGDRNSNLRNPRKFLAFMDIGGVTAESINAKPLDKILDTSVIDNFGWGRSIIDGKAREGTFYVNPGNGGVLGGEPSCESNAPSPEAGYIQPWIQFGRTATDSYYAISSLSIPSKAINKVQLLWSEFNTGHIMGTEEFFKPTYKGYSGPSKAYKFKVYDTNMTLLEGSLNDLVKEELGEVGYYRGDARLFTYPDGQAGAFIERTGVFYKLTEINMQI